MRPARVPRLELRKVSSPRYVLGSHGKPIRLINKNKLEKMFHNARFN